MGLLEKKIDDTKFLNVIREMLKAGYVEDWKFYPTYSGTPQGGIPTLPTKLQTCR
jgi:RNA-directed DNA polymerase